MLLLVSHANKLHLASDIALTSVVFGLEPTLVLWPAVARRFADDAPLKKKLEEFGVSSLFQLSANSDCSPDIPVIDAHQITTLTTQHQKVQSF